MLFLLLAIFPYIVYSCTTLILFVTVSGITGGALGAGGQSASPETSDWEISADLPGKKRQGKKRKGVKIEKKRRKIVKGNVEN